MTSLMPFYGTWHLDRFRCELAEGSSSNSSWVPKHPPPPNNDVIRLELLEMLVSRGPSKFHLSRLEEDCKSSAVPKEYREYVKELAARLNTSGPERETRVIRRPRIWIRVLKLIIC